MVFNLRIDTFDPNNNQVISDDAVLLYKQHFSQWYSFGHVERLSKDRLAAGCENVSRSNFLSVVDPLGGVPISRPYRRRCSG